MINSGGCLSQTGRSGPRTCREATHPSKALLTTVTTRHEMGLNKMDFRGSREGGGNLELYLVCQCQGQEIGYTKGGVRDPYLFPPVLAGHPKDVVYLKITKHTA